MVIYIDIGDIKRVVLSTKYNFPLKSRLLENVAKLKLEAVHSDEMSLFIGWFTYLHLRAREHAVSLRKVIPSQSPAKSTRWYVRPS